MSGAAQGPSRSAPPTPNWWIYHGTGRPLGDSDPLEALPEPPRWRTFSGGPLIEEGFTDDAESDRRLGDVVQAREGVADRDEVNAVNAALYLRRPLLVTGKPGTGKSSLAYRIARELRLGPVLRWPITTSSTMSEGLYDYDAIGRVQAAGSRRGLGSAAEAIVPDADIGRFIRLGPLGTALLPRRRPRVLLIDEFDKSDVDLPNNLLNVMEEGEFEVRELARLPAELSEVAVMAHSQREPVVIHRGRVRCRAFPVVVITSNGERDFPPAFRRRCLQLTMKPPTEDQLAAWVAAHFRGTESELTAQLIGTFLRRNREEGDLAADQLLNAVHLATSGAYEPDESWNDLLTTLWRRLDVPGTE